MILVIIKARIMYGCENHWAIGDEHRASAKFPSVIPQTGVSGPTSLYHSPDFGVNLAGGVKLITSFSPLLSPSRSWPALRPQIMKVSKLCHGHHLTPISIGFPEPVIFFFQASVGI